MFLKIKEWEKIFLFNLMCCERHFKFYEKTRSTESEWLKTIIEEIWGITIEKDFQIDNEAVHKNIEYITSLYGNGYGIGSDFLL
ncbi:hypothetical protein EV682_1203 [Iodobacter fluviatilis]|uniref:Uncharacterized protein n=1 Tax=Iodobacter fluviatilis TaxID=537 RepID=A0A377SUZ6_9NEIS|nr:hypothetical protein [Iodobacter fluviatilis]TCU81603.1 hypothetical protein EV682_1203 [Iodobacter fluviatilis]STR44797.1 Uncharacterised protein [Iodobacter fluviatilis]